MELQLFLAVLFLKKKFPEKVFYMKNEHSQSYKNDSFLQDSEMVRNKVKKLYDITFEFSFNLRTKKSF